LLFAAGWSLRSRIYSFAALGGLLLAEMLWGFISHQILFPGKKSHVLRWSAINLVAIAIAIPVVDYPFQHKSIVLMVVSILRTIADYGFCWDFYFPRQ
jgi:hypothetical protein